MHSLSNLVEQLPQIDSPELVNQGFGVWIVWEDELPDSIPETLQGYGGWEIASSEQQSLWVFISEEVLLACAQIFKWFNQEDQVVSLRVFPVKINVGSGLKHSLSVEDRILQISTDKPRHFEIWMHVRLKDAGQGIQGLRFEAPATSFIPHSDQWYLLRATEPSLFSSSLSWIFLLKPAGKLAGPDAGKNWKKQKDLFRGNAERIGFEVKDLDEYLVFQIDGVRQLRSWVLEALSIFQGLKPGKHLSCQMFCKEVEQQKSGLLIPPDLLSMEWTLFQPDTLYLPLKNVFQLGTGFKLVDRGSSKQKTIRDFAGVVIDKQLLGDVDQRLEVFIPKSLTQGRYEACFYCGLKSHKLHICPTRNQFNLDPIWEQLEKKSLNDIAKGLEQLGKEVAAGTSLQNIIRQSSITGLILRAIFAINYPVQHKTLRLVWRSRGNAWPEGLRMLSPMEESLIWSALENLRMGQTVFAESSAKKAGFQFPKDFRPKTLLGIIALEKENPKDARNFLNEAISLGYTSLQKAYHFFLKARMKEVENDFSQAQQLYQDAMQAAPEMSEARYRQGVCMVKAGFIDQALGHMGKLIRENPEYFNHVLIDPELDTGHPQLMSGLHPIWVKASKEVKSVQDAFPKLENKISSWFDPDHPASSSFMQRLGTLRSYSDIDNYCARVRIIRGSKDLYKDISKTIGDEVIRLKKDQKDLTARLKSIKVQVRSFPFSVLLMGGLSQEIKEALNRLRQAAEEDPGTARGFRRMNAMTDQVAEQVRTLEKKLSSHKTIRDGLLFVLIMFRTFLWTIIVIMLVSLILVPAAVYLGIRHELTWLNTLYEQKGYFFQVGLAAATMFALGLAAFKTFIGFEKKKAAYLKAGK